MAQGVAWGARELGVPCTVVMPDSAPRTKIDAVERLGADDRVAAVRRVVADARAITDATGMAGTFIHPGRRPRRHGRQRDDRFRDR